MRALSSVLRGAAAVNDSSSSGPSSRYASTSCGELRPPRRASARTVGFRNARSSRSMSSGSGRMLPTRIVSDDRSSAAKT